MNNRRRFPRDNDSYYRSPASYSPAYDYRGGRVEPRSRYYYDIYDVPSRYHPYYDSDQYYRKPYGYGYSDDNGIEDLHSR